MNEIRGSSLFRIRGRVAGIAAALVLISTSAFGTAISAGEDNTAGVVLVNMSGIFFSSFTTTGPDTGAYAGNTTVTQGSLMGTPTLTPNLPAWATFTGTSPGPIMFDLQTLNAGIGTNAMCSSNTVGNVCTPTGSPITLSQIAPNVVSLSLAGNGIAYTGTSASGSTLTTVSFTTQNNLPGTITDILMAVNSKSGFTDSVSATYTSTSSVPEPMTVSMLGFGLVCLGLFSRRRKVM
jgi:hypothetical protein